MTVAARQRLPVTGALGEEVWDHGHMARIDRLWR
jgi:hypothetical protein